MDNIWFFKQAKLIYSSNVDNFDFIYDENILKEIKIYLDDINKLPDSLKREIKIDTILD